MLYLIRLREGLEYERRKLSDKTILTMNFKKIGEEVLKKGKVEKIIDITENRTPWTEINKKLWDDLKGRDSQKKFPEFEFKTEDKKPEKKKSK